MDVCTTHVCVYGPRNFSNVKNILNQFKRGHIIVAFDLNLNMLVVNEHTSDLIDILSESSSIILNHEHTHFMPNCNPSCIDLLISNNPDRVIIIDDVDVPCLSHHDMMVLSFELPIEE